MSTDVTTTISGGDVLHVRPEPSGDRSDQIDEVLAAAEVTVEQCGDAYRALATIARRDPVSLHAVIISLDAMTDAEMPFFSLVSSVHRSVPVYVYGLERSEGRIGQAISLGASAQFTDEIVDSIAASAHMARSCSDATPQTQTHTASSGHALTAEARSEHTPDPPPQAEAPSERAPTQDSPTHEPDRIEPTTPPAHLQDSAYGTDERLEADAVKSTENEHTSANDASVNTEPAGQTDAQPLAREPAGPARVPWLRYRDLPTRTKPDRTLPGAPPDAPPPDSAPLGKPPESSREPQPLLTDEELQALIGDAPESSPPTSDPDDQGSTGGLS